MRNRVEIRFRKHGDLRMISHRDLVRAFERLFRRAELELSMSEGFHPKPRLSFPSALALGVEALDEVMLVELSQPIDTEDIVRRLRSSAPHGLTINDVCERPLEDGKPRIERLVYRFPIPEQRREEVKAAIDHLMSQKSYPIDREGRQEPIDVRAGLDELTLVESEVEIAVCAGRDHQVRPREVLDILGLANLESAGSYLTRTAVEFAP